MLKLIAAVAAAAMAVAAVAAPGKPKDEAAWTAPKSDPPSCAEHARWVDLLDRQVASTDASSLGDNSAARETNRLLKQMLLQQRQQMHVSAMLAEHCSTVPVGSGGTDYIMAAMTCTLATPSEKTGACMIGSWQKLSRPASAPTGGASGPAQ